mgnify:CR=1 FL=1
MADRQGEIDALVQSAIEATPRAKLVEGGTEHEFFCPAHDGSDNPHAYWNRRKGTWVCMKCGASGTTADLAKRLGVKLPEERRARADFRIVKEYDYTDEAGNLIFQVVRMEPKDFRVRRPSGNPSRPWTWDRKGVTPVLYQLPRVVSTPADEWVLLLEGEKDVDRAIKEGYEHATTNPFGAQEASKSGAPGKPKWEPQYTESLRGRNVAICLDTDNAGRNSARQIAAILRPHVQRVVMVELPGLPLEREGRKFKDLSDWFALGNTVDDLRAAIALAVAQPEQPAVATDAIAEHDADDILRFSQTDAGNGELFAHLYGQVARFDHMRGRWLLWKGDWWGPDADGQLYRWAIDAARFRAKAASDLDDGEASKKAFAFAKASESAGRIESAIKLARNQPPIADPGKGWDEAPMLLGVANGVIDLTTGTLRRGQQSDRITMRTDVHYDSEAQCPRWLKFLDEVSEGDAEMIAYLQRAIGYSLTGSTKEQVWFLLHGKGQNGKSTLLEALQEVLGDYAGVLPFTALEKGKESGIPTDLAALPGKRFVTASEANPGASLNEARIKMLTGDRGITARQLYERQFTFAPQLKLFVGVNHLPSVRDSSFGFWRRVRVIGFHRIFTEAEKDADLPLKLKEEQPGILAWAVRGARIWHSEGGLRDPQRVLLATVEYQNDSDPIAEFIRECCLLMPRATARAADLYAEYSTWADRRGLQSFERMSSTKFGREIGDRVTGSRHTNRGKEYLGIGLRFKRKEESDGFAQPVTDSEIESDGLTPFYQTSPRDPLHARDLGENPSTRHNPSLPCLCAGRHGPDDAACGGTDWFHQTADDSYHCRICDGIEETE